MIRIIIDTGNAAFEDDQHATEVARILQRLVERLRCGDSLPASLLDINGNAVGSVTLTGRDRRL